MAATARPQGLRAWALGELWRRLQALEREAHPSADEVEREVYPDDHRIAVRRNERRRQRRENRKHGS